MGRNSATAQSPLFTNLPLTWFGAHISAMLSRITSRASLAFIAIMLLVVISVFLLLIYLRLAAIEQTLSGLDVCGTSTTPCHTILH
jgi:hypothetical protein